MGELHGLCHVCGKIANHTCKMCGRPACDEHYDPKLRLCVSCKSGRK